MVIDAGKGIESQTRKLFEICANGVSHIHVHEQAGPSAMPPLELLDQLKRYFPYTRIL
jgi:peptide chain release factor 3